MNGNELLEKLKEIIAKRLGKTDLPDRELAKELGVTQTNLIAYRRNGFTPLKVAKLVERVRNKSVEDLRKTAILPIVEFCGIDATASRGNANWELFSPNLGEQSHRYLLGIQERLRRSHGVYIFYDSRGRAIYAGRAIDQSLWKEMTSAFNRHRGDVQSIKRVSHPQRNVAYRGPNELNRPIRKQDVHLSEIAWYFSAYEVEKSLIAPVEALLIRGFANDLLNTRMENL